MNNICNKNVYIGDKTVITDWRNAKIVAPENLQENIRVNENAKAEIKKQKVAQINNFANAAV